eukprot:764256-Hanusia_phi.AAC.3
MDFDVFFLLTKLQGTQKLLNAVWDMADSTSNESQNNLYGPNDWHCKDLFWTRDMHRLSPCTGYSYNRNDSWTKVHDWGCYNWNMIAKWRV